MTHIFRPYVQSSSQYALPWTLLVLGTGDIEAASKRNGDGGLLDDERRGRCQKSKVDGDCELREHLGCQ